MAEPTATWTLAVTGPTAAGKTELCRRLAALGATVIEADRVGHELLRHPDVRERIVAAFGPEILGADGEIDRRALGPRVFASTECRERLDRLVHPALSASCAARMRAAVAGGSPLVILEAAVYFLLPGPPPADVTITVTADPQRRRQRLIAAGLAAEAAERRVAAQAHLEPTWTQSDRIIVNDGDETDLAAMAAALWREFGAPADESRETR